MIEMACPSCGRAGQVPKEKLHTRLVCRKCHMVFHVDSQGRPCAGRADHREGEDQEGERTEVDPPDAQDTDARPVDPHG